MRDWLFLFAVYLFNFVLIGQLPISGYTMAIPIVWLLLCFKDAWMLFEIEQSRKDISLYKDLFNEAREESFAFKSALYRERGKKR